MMPTNSVPLYSGGPNRLHHLAAGLLRDTRLVLDIGCGRGYLADLLRAQVDGIELDHERANDARGRCRQVHEFSADDQRLRKVLGGPYDALVMIDALEHFPDPSAVLTNLLPSLSPSGCILAIIPNVAHISHRLTLLRGQWDYTDEGILDRTHLRFYTWLTGAQLLERVGLRIIMHDAVLRVPRILRWLPKEITSRRPNLLGSHTVLVAQPYSAESAMPALPSAASHSTDSIS